ncbi:MAG: TRAP-type transport system small permease protein [Acetobacteraceae bacterium]|jgi:TRAP-type C4-dicarboxylate transport system permease small subunit|nr:TRAP-type transport system small permease protein [Acetobacteraceae bacterium]
MSEAAFAAEAGEDRFHPAPTLLEKVCMWICEIGIVAMGAIVILEIVTRNLFGFSFEMSEELGGYIIVGISFLSLPVCQVYRSYHHVQFIQSRLSPRMQALSHLVFDVLSLMFCAVLLWQLTRFVATSYRSEDVAPTLLATPLWIPQALMPIGVLAATVSLLRAAWGNWRRFMSSGV